MLPVIWCLMFHGKKGSLAYHHVTTHFVSKYNGKRLEKAQEDQASSKDGLLITNRCGVLSV